MASPEVLLVSSPVDLTRASGAGLWTVEAGQARQIDGIGTAGISLDPQAGRVLRALHLTDAATLDGAVLDYQAGRRVKLRRLSGFGDIHDVRFLSHGPMGVASYQNAVVPLERGPRKALRLSGEPDSWHLNCLEEAGGDLFATAFVRGGCYRQWATVDEPNGLLMCISTRVAVVAGLNAPHHPRLIDEGWLVCNSGTAELLLFERDVPHALIARLQLRSWTRGLAVVGDLIYVGESAGRREEGGKASVVTVSRSDWKVVDRLSLPTGEIYDILPAPRAVAEELSDSAAPAAVLANRFCSTRRIAGWRRSVPAGSRATCPLDGHVYGVSVRARLPERLLPGALFHVNACVINEGEETLSAKGPHPKTIGFRWFDEHGREVSLAEPDQLMRTALPRDLAPGHRLDIRARARAPMEEGRFVLSVSVVHELVAWLDDLDQFSAARGTVLVTREYARR